MTAALTLTMTCDGCFTYYTIPNPTMPTAREDLARGWVCLEQTTFDGGTQRLYCNECSPAVLAAIEETAAAALKIGVEK